MEKCHVICVDLDGVLAKGEAWTVKDCLNAEPIHEAIETVNRLSRKNFIVIWTARRDHLIPATLAWLRKHDVHFHAISNNKTPADFYVDDKAFASLYALEAEFMPDGTHDRY